MLRCFENWVRSLIIVVLHYVRLVASCLYEGKPVILGQFSIIYLEVNGNMK